MYIVVAIGRGHANHFVIHSRRSKGTGQAFGSLVQFAYLIVGAIL